MSGRRIEGNCRLILQNDIDIEISQIDIDIEISQIAVIKLY